MTGWVFVIRVMPKQPALALDVPRRALRDAYISEPERHSFLNSFGAEELLLLEAMTRAYDSHEPLLT